MSRLSLPFFFLVSTLFVASCAKMDDTTLATIGDKTIPMEDFTSKNPASRFAGKDNDFIDSKVDEFVKRELFTYAAFDRGLDSSPDIVEKKTANELRHMLQYVYDKDILGAVISDSYLRDIYDRGGEELKAKHILLQFEGKTQSQSQRSKTDALAVMGQIKNRLSKGESFEGLAKEFTDDPSGKTSGGDLGWFGWGKMVPPFQDAVFALKPGEISDVVETAFGFHIIKLEERRELKRGSFEDEKPGLTQQARRAKTAELSERAASFIAKQKADANFTLITENIHAFFVIYEKSSFANLPMDEAFKGLSFAAPLFRLNSKELGGDWIVERLSNIEPSQRPAFRSENQFVSILDQLVIQALITDHGFSMGYDKEEAFIAKINSLIARFVYDAFVNKEVNIALNPEDDALMAFYEKNKTGKYMDKKKVQIREVFVKDSLLAVDIKKRIDAGEDIGVLAQRYTERRAAKDNKGELPPFQEGRYGVMGKKAFSMQEGQLAGPISLGNGYSVFRVENHIPEQARPYTEVKGRVKSELTSELRKQQSEKVHKDLLKRYPVKVNYSGVRDFYVPVKGKDA
jgi:parvulin-like peptidyl-prolyl isomerase